MLVKKRSGKIVEMELDKITKRVAEHSAPLGIDPISISSKVAGGVYNEIKTTEIDNLIISTASFRISEDSNYSLLAARVLASVIDKEVQMQEIDSFSDSVAENHRNGLLNDDILTFVKKYRMKLNQAVKPKRDEAFEYFGLKTVYDRYLLKHPTTRQVTETPQYFFMRVACGLAQTIEEAVEIYNLLSSLDYMTSTPTLFNSGTKRSQMSSCYLLDSPADDIGNIYDTYKDVALLSKWSGGIGLSYSRIRSAGSLIKGTNGHSNGIIPWLKTLDSSVASVNQCFSPETPIFTYCGVKNIGDIKPGDLVLAWRGQFRRVEKIMSYPQKDSMIQIETKYSIDPIKLTAGHPVYAIVGAKLALTHKSIYSRLAAGKIKADWTESGKLAIGDFVGTPIPTEVVATRLTEDDFRFYGIMLGDGHNCAGRTECGVTLGHAKAETLSFVRKYLASHNVNTWETSNESMVSVKWTHKGMPFEPTDIYDSNGEKAVAPKFLHVAPNLGMAIVRGLIETDGGIYRKNEIHLYTSSKALLMSVKYLLLRNGVLASTSLAKHKAHEGLKATGERYTMPESVGYDLRIPAVEVVARALGIPATYKKNWLSHQGMLFARITNISETEISPTVHDLIVEGDESYTVLDFLAHNGGKRKGAACVYLDTWHADIESFLELRDNTGDEARRTHNLNLANWIPDLFMKRVEADQLWSLFDPAVAPQLVDLYGADFDAEYTRLEEEKKFKKQVKARDLYGRMMKTLAETGNGWMNFKDPSNEKSNQTKLPGNTIHSSNLCTEILEVTSKSETAVCNLGSINLSNHVVDGKVDYQKIARTARTAVKYLDRVIDINYYPIESSKNSNTKWRPVGLGIMGLQDVFFKLGLAFDSVEAREISKKIQEEIYWNALRASVDIAAEHGAHESYQDTRAADGFLQPDLWGQEAQSETVDIEKLRSDIKTHGLRNSLLIAIAPTATIASIVGVYECTEPQISNLFKRETLSGEFVQINKYLERELMKLNLWTEDLRREIKDQEGSIQQIEAIPSKLKDVFRTVWEVPMKSLIEMAADRAPFIDQSQSLNLFMESPTIGKVSSMYMYAWKKGIKTTYYLRSRPATRIAKTTGVKVEEKPKKEVTQEQAIACSLENPEACESCQ